MGPNTLRRAAGAFSLLAPPILFANLLFIINYGSVVETVFFATLALLYIIMMASRVNYSDLLMGRVNFDGIPTYLREALVETDQRGDYVNVEIMRMLGKKPKMSQSEAARWLNAKGISLTQPAVAKYLSRLEGLGMLSSTKTAYVKQYSLCGVGVAALRAIEQVLPQRYFWFIIRNEIGVRTFKPISSEVTLPND